MKDGRRNGITKVILVSVLPVSCLVSRHRLRSCFRLFPGLSQGVANRVWPAERAGRRRRASMAPQCSRQCSKRPGIACRPGRSSRRGWTTPIAWSGSPDDFQPPSPDVAVWFESWLATRPHRTLIYVGRDFDAAPWYWRKMEAEASPIRRRRHANFAMPRKMHSRRYGDRHARRRSAAGSLSATAGRPER